MTFIRGKHYDYHKGDSYTKEEFEAVKAVVTELDNKYCQPRNMHPFAQTMDLIWEATKKMDTMLGWSRQYNWLLAVEKSRGKEK